MFAVINHFPLDIPVAQVAAEMEADGFAVLAAQPGFQGCYVVQEEEQRAAVVIFWTDGEAAAAGGRVMGATWFHDHVAPHLTGDQARTLGPVVAQRVG